MLITLIVDYAATAAAATLAASHDDVIGQRYDMLHTIATRAILLQVITPLLIDVTSGIHYSHYTLRYG